MLEDMRREKGEMVYIVMKRVWRNGVGNCLMQIMMLTWWGVGERAQVLVA